MALFLSTIVNKIDSKGRVSVPASFRAVLAGKGFQSFVAYPSRTMSAIDACDPGRLEKLADSMDDSYEFDSPELNGMAATIFSRAHELGWDGEGRIMLPEALILHAGITQQVVFIGLGHSFQIWEPEAHRAASTQGGGAPRPGPGLRLGKRAET